VWASDFRVSMGTFLRGVNAELQKRKPQGRPEALRPSGVEGDMRLTQRVPSLVGYCPPPGFRITSVQKLSDGSYEVTLEPWRSLANPLSSGGGCHRLQFCPDCNVYRYDVVNGKRGTME